MKKCRGKVSTNRSRSSRVFLFFTLFLFLFFNFYLSLDGHTDDDILLKWRNPTISIANKEMAQFSVGDPTLSTEVNEFSTGKSAR